MKVQDRHAPDVWRLIRRVLLDRISAWVAVPGSRGFFMETVPSSNSVPELARRLMKLTVGDAWILDWGHRVSRMGGALDFRTLPEWCEAS